MMVTHLLLFLLLLILYISCNPNEINIHIIPHTHLDVGWIRTIEEYRTKVESIFYTVVSDMKLNPNRTFVFCEMEYFEKWYKASSANYQSLIRTWLLEKRIEFVGGGVTMNDEGNAYYEDIIHNYRSGFSFLSKEFGIKPKTGWFLDSFGHTAGNAHIAAKLGFKQMVLGRLDKDDLVNRIKEKTLEFTWKPFNNDEILTHLLPFHYGGTQTFAKFFFTTSSAVSENTVKNWVAQSIPTIRSAMKGLHHNHYMFLVGDDFTYEPNNKIFNNIDAYIDYLEKYVDKDKGKVNVFYSTPSKYFEAVRNAIQAQNTPLTTQYSIDFMPYSCQGNIFWSAYYTSRPYLKGKIRAAANLYLISSKMMTELLLKSKSKPINEINRLLNLVGLMQHHDTITGTSQERVNINYLFIMNNVLQNVNKYTQDVIDEEYINAKITKVCLSNPIVDFGCNNEFNLLNDTSNKNSNEMIIGIVNPLIDGKLLIGLEFASVVSSSASLSQYYYNAYDHNDVLIESDFYCIEDPLFKYNSTCFMNFFYTFSKDIELTSFKLKNSFKTVEKLHLMPKEKVILNNVSPKINTITFDPNTLNYSITFSDSTSSLSSSVYTLSLSHAYYDSYYHKQQKCHVNYTNFGGAYIFAPCKKDYTPYTTSLANSYIFKGKISFVTVIRYETSFIVATIFYYPSFMKVDSIMDPIPRGKGFNFALVLNSDINNSISLPPKPSNNTNDANANVNVISNEFWTDSNGIKMMRRIVNYRDTFDFNTTQTIASNFYPIVESISIREKASQEYSPNKYEGLSTEDRMISVFNDRPQSGGVLSNKGEIIILLTGSSIVDDQKGLAEPLYEPESMTQYLKVQHIIMFGSNIFNKKKDTEIKALKFMYNYFHNTPVLFNSLKGRYFNSYSILSQIIFASENLGVNYYFLIENMIEVQFYCKYDYYYQTSVRNDNMISHFGFISVNIEGYNVELNGEYVGENEYFRKQILIQMKSAKKFYVKLGVDDIYILQIKFL